MHYYVVGTKFVCVTNCVRICIYIHPYLTYTCAEIDNGCSQEQFKERREADNPGPNMVSVQTCSK